MYQAFALSAELFPRAEICQVPEPNENTIIKRGKMPKRTCDKPVKYDHMLRLKWPKSGNQWKAKL